MICFFPLLIPFWFMETLILEEDEQPLLSVSPCPYPEHWLKTAKRTHSSCPTSCEQPVLTPAVPGYHENGRESRKLHQEGLCHCRWWCGFTAAGLGDAVPKLMQRSLVRQVWLRLRLHRSFTLTLYITPQVNYFIQIAAVLEAITAARALLC